MAGCNSELSMEKQKSGKKKLGSWLKKLVQHKDKALDHQHRDFRVPELQHLSPLSAHSNRKKQHLATQQLAARHAQDDCGQQLASSDQEASQVARIEDQGLLSSYASEHYGSECSLSESVRAATAHMATLRSLLVSHITETHEARTVNGKLTGPNLLEALQERQQQLAGATASRSSSRPCSSSRHPPGSPGTADSRVQALMADQMQLLDLVGTLIDDHRRCLLEQQRLREQLAAMQQALHSERLDKDRVAALADVRSEEASRAQADLAAASAAVQQLHTKRAISSRRIQLPPADLAAAAAAYQSQQQASGVRQSVSVLSDAEQECSSSAAVQPGSGSGRGEVRQEDGWQLKAAGESGSGVLTAAAMICPELSGRSVV
ncbi:hypothetical protein OEZ85_005020 [Tetradesmus obliquus]|uniref:Uncharacterized protein n=1 Tax=Tetradesmus obliquus TaxID=3088 RepID=A0ABY8UH96_TETOB|nr:hypothetical protein OEZ85_005020 [Tetradesmus obliquus]